MDFDVFELKKRILCYQNKKYTKKELGVWAENAYYDLMKGGFLETKKLALLPLLKIISKIHIEDNERLDEYASSKEDIEFVQKILNGEESYEFAVELGVSAKLYDFFSDNKNFDKERLNIYQALKIELQRTNCNRQKIKEIMGQIIELERKPELILDYLEQRIIEMLSVLMNETGNSNFRKEYNFYAKNAERSSLYSQLERYIDCRVGKCNFIYVVCFRNGETETSYYI